MEVGMDLDQAALAFREFVSIIKALRTPVTGCPWDLEQNHQTLRPYLIEETYEVLDAIDSGNDRSFRDELGDLLLQVVLHAQVADDRNAFSITEVVLGIAEKMVRRHPHVFGGVKVTGSAEVARNWEQIKVAENQREDGSPSKTNSLARLPESLPALLRAQRLGEKAARTHDDCGSAADALGGVREAFARLEEEVRTVAGASAPGSRLTEALQTRIEDELGDVLFRLCQLARWLGVNAEDSLRTACGRFVERFQTRNSQDNSKADLPETNP